MIIDPKQFTLGNRRYASPFFGVYYGLHDVTGERLATPADLFQTLGKFPSAEVIRWVAALGRWLWEIDAITPKNQLAMAEVMLSGESYQSLLKNVGEQQRNWCVFHRRQIWFLLQAAVLSCRESTPCEDEETLRHGIGQCCLMANDILQQLETLGPPEDGPDGANRWMTTLAVPLMDGQDRFGPPARAWSFWLDLPREPWVRKRFEEIGVPDLESAFVGKYGVQLREAFLILLTLNLCFQAHALQNKQPLLLNESEYFSGSFDQERVRTVMGLNRTTPRGK